MALEDIIIYKGHQIVLIREILIDKFVNGYVYLEHLQEMPKELTGETYRKGKIIGVDTAHYYNQKMTYEQKKEDAIRQIKTIIDEYEELIGGN